ncbi:MAG: serine/threonine-protein phosphatase, partial [Mesorhizobium sp.]
MARAAARGRAAKDACEALGGKLNTVAPLPFESFGVSHKG